VLRDHQFPPSEFANAAGPTRATRQTRNAKIERLARLVKDWRKDCKDGSAKASTYYKQFEAQPPCDAVPSTASVQRIHPLGWLRRELIHAGYEDITREA
jgi:hypothetical protein